MVMFTGCGAGTKGENITIKKYKGLEIEKVEAVKVTDADVLKKDDAMTYAYYHNVIKGKSPKAAPTYIQED